MAGPISRIHELVNGALPAYVNLNLVYRGTSAPVDRFLSGTARFAKKVGSLVPIFLADVHMDLAEAIADNDSIVYVKSAVQWLTPNCLVKIGGRELRTVTDIVTNEIHLDRPLLSSYEISDSVVLHATVLALHSDINPLSVDSVTDPDLPRLVKAAEGFGPLLVEGDYYLSTGDKIALLRNAGNLGSLNEIQVSYATRLDVVGKKVTEIYLSSNIFNPEDFLVEGYQLYLRAFPCYQSKKLALPTNPGQSVPSGPLLVDWLSGTVREGDQIAEFFTVRTFAPGNNTPLGTLNNVAKNYLVTQIPIQASSVLTWDLIHGSLNYRITGVEGICDSLGRLAVSTILVPNIQGPVRWYAVIRPSKAATLTWKFAPDAESVVPLVAGVTNNVPIELLDEDNYADRLELAISGEPGTTVLFGGFITDSSYVREVEYDVVAHTDGRVDWMCSGLLVKSMFKSIVDLQSYTNATRTNAGQLLAQRGF